MTTQTRLLSSAAQAALITIILSFALDSTPARADSEHSRSREVTVTGTCIRQVTTDRGSVIVTADVRDNDLKTAVAKATRQHERALEGVKKLKLPDADIQTSEYNVAEVREWEKNRTVSKGFRARIGFRVSTSDVRRLGEVAEIASREEIREVGALSTYLSDEKIRKEQDLCLEEAARHAHEKAEKLATTLGTSLGPILMLNENNITAPQAPIMQRMSLNSFAADKAEASAPSIEGGKQEVTATIQATFSLK